MLWSTLSIVILSLTSMFAVDFRDYDLNIVLHINTLLSEKKEWYACGLFLDCDLKIHWYVLCLTYGIKIWTEMGRFVFDFEDCLKLFFLKILKRFFENRFFVLCYS